MSVVVDGKNSEPNHVVELRRRIEEEMTLAYSRELEEELNKLTPVQIDDNLLESQFAYRDLVKGVHRGSVHAAGRDWAGHVLEYGPLFFTLDPYEPPSGYTYEMALGFRKFCNRWESARTCLGRAMSRVFEEAGRLGLIDDPVAVAELRNKVVEELTAAGARNIVKTIFDPEVHEVPWQVAKSPTAILPHGKDIGYRPEDVKLSAYGKPIEELRATDLVRIDANQLPEICQMIDIMRLLGKTRHAIYCESSRMSKLQLEAGGREVPLSDWKYPRPIEDRHRHTTWSRAEVIRWKEERERKKESPKKKGGKS